MKKIRHQNFAVLLNTRRGAAKKLAEMLGVSKPTITGWKIGARPIPIERLPDICKFL